MLRDVLTSLPGLATWPCDEINYIWRHGNVRYPSDEFTQEMADDECISFIRRQFKWVANRYKVHTVVEKTCANTLRVPFVDKILPEAKYIFIRRNGLDAVDSAMKRWNAKLDLPYVIRKARFVPIADIPFYGYRYLWNHVYRNISKQKRLAFWGPKINGMDKILSQHSLDEVCAIQWKRCVDSSIEAFMEIEGDRWIEVGYEEFVSDPQKGLANILFFLELEFNQYQIEKAVARVSSSSIGKGRNKMDDKMLSRLLPLIEDTMDRFGYT
jgi:hypothetical protein